MARPKKINQAPRKPLATREQKILKAQELALLERQLEIKECLPHLYGLRWYSWQWNFFVSRHKINLLTASNQCGKSVAQIRKAIDWATDVKKWKELWPHSTPRQFWYFYPSKDLITSEIEQKWVPEFLPRGKFKEHSVYGWKLEYEKGTAHSIVFNSGVTIYFKSYEQKLKNLQGSSCHAVFVDEELPEDFIPEVMARLGGATIQGYFHAVFTATIGQEFWRLAMEPGENEKENFPDAFKQQISLYDCMTYKDGTPGPWTEEMIQQRIKACVDEGEVQRRVFGKFVSKEGRQYPTYIPDRHFIKPVPIDPEWKIYSAIDHGSGRGAHPPAIVFIAVRPDFQFAYVFKCFRGDDAVFTAGDVIQKWKDMGAGMHITQSWYDHEAKDLKTIAERQGENINTADKARDKGQQILNTLFKNDMLKIFDDEEGQGAKLGGELIGLKENTNKSKAKDDLCFHGDTLIKTLRGEIPISEVLVGDHALTSAGYRPIVAKTKSIAHVIALSRNGETTWVTPKHKYKTTSGSKSAESLGAEDYCLALTKEERQRSLSLKEFALEDTPITPSATLGCTFGHQPIIEKASAPYIKKFTKSLREKLKLTLWFITLMAIRSITVQKILNYLISLCTCPCTPQSQRELPSQKKTSNAQESSQMYGMEAKPDLSFIGVSAAWLGQGLNQLKKSVYAAAVNTQQTQYCKPQQSFAQTTASLSTEEIAVWTKSKKLVWSATRSIPLINTFEQKPVLENVQMFPALEQKKLSFVYNITVSGEHEYFANGVLVENCDALRYTIVGIPWDWSVIAKHLTEEEIQIGKIKKAPPTEQELLEQQIRERRGEYPKSDEPWAEFYQEFDDWNEMYG